MVYWYTPRKHQHLSRPTIIIIISKDQAQIYDSGCEVMTKNSHAVRQHKVTNKWRFGRDGGRWKGWR